MTVAALLTGAVAANVYADEFDEDSTPDTAMSSTWDESSWDEASWDQASWDKAFNSAGYARTSPQTGAGTAAAVILACAGFAGAGIGASKFKK